MIPSKFDQRKFVSVDPFKCTGCGICEYACSQEKGDAWSPLRSRIRVVRVKPLINFSLACRFCEDAKCVTACPEKALSQFENTGVLLVDAKKCKGCDWCVQACPHGGITVHPDLGTAVACDLCDGKPQCVEYCPEEALELLTSDGQVEEKFTAALEKIPVEIERINELVKKKEWQRILSETETRSMRVKLKINKAKLARLSFESF
jgi:carbon-monoxide dehydrogenase iron sulfur subunit